MAREGRTQNPEARMRLAGHLREFKRRFLISGLAFVAAAIGGFFLAAPLLQLLSSPLDELQAQGLPVELNVTNITQALDVQMRIAFFLGLVLSSPVWIWQLLAFVVPALRGIERRYVFGFIASAVPLFVAGCATGWFILPRIIRLFVGFTPQGFTAFLGASDYWDFSLKLVFAVGVAYVLPVIVVFLNLAGVISGRSILHGWRWAVLAATLFGAFVTPAGEVLSMFIIAVPMVVLYFAAAGIAILVDRRRAKRALELSGTEATA
ncbi:twin-arginine translocase subunit TatC [Agrococcus sp. HG114]|uniref:twin-arginine translocase subunit TatC n=1 Tax=Agrococcus sp. HG114 TaxID=2969757 RepID=UPI00215A40C6|nr:twin-arginine translocase subunit TatC [Agrococcus sp. HG114]MCR8669711.1 twin-arginine translocase subunit TatC [Agrococcus sp. HG114]